MNININDDQLKETLKYIVCGGITTAVNLAIFYVLTEMGIYYLLSNIIGYYIAVAINFWMNQIYVFNKKASADALGRLWKFAKLRTLSLIVDSILFFLLVTICGFPTYLCRIILSIIIITVNYFWSKYKIFKNT